MAKSKARSRLSQEINAGSMADIAFLLLIFFLVTTTIDTDKGITIKLPPWSDDKVPPLPVNTRNVYSVLVNKENQLLVRLQPMEPRELRKNAKEFIVNPTGREDYAEKPTKAVISLKNDRGTKYETYLMVYNELKAAYDELWDEAAQKKFGKPYQALQVPQQKAIRDEIPLVISEAEPTAFGDEK